MGGWGRGGDLASEMTTARMKRMIPVVGMTSIETEASAGAAPPAAAPPAPASMPAARSSPFGGRSKSIFIAAIRMKIIRASTRDLGWRVCGQGVEKCESHYLTSASQTDSRL